MKTLVSLAAAAALTLGVAASANAEEFQEFPIGEAKTINTLEVAAVYLKPIDMEPRGIDLPASQADIHLEADIHAAEANPNGFGAGEWVPYLTVSYRLENQDTGKVLTGNLMPMVAVDGPHYGANIKMPGTGNYKLSYNIDPPSRQGFGRHTDKASGVGQWFQSFAVDYEFKYVPLK
ncbi:iron transporter [Rhodospirillum rubrum]|uniref:iron transporter n=1 Tax=Rhodospirillum rubrum TaxID=1085 RepID=UPI0019061E8D|nr:iron transporter [Rhodospirillum rubrum]MBK1663888.1 iron transporter [Rhodospirillum rubrum]MBK1676727.1 iron transporter [Rhodospirillum rubrum]